MGRGTAWKAHDVDMVRGWMAAGKTTTAMAKLRRRRALCGTRSQGQQRLLLRTHAAAVLLARHPRESCDERAVSLLRGQRAQPRVGLHSRVHSAEQAAQ